jgi:hypothetical protein
MLFAAVHWSLYGFRRDRREAVFLSGVNKKFWFNFKLRAH